MTRLLGAWENIVSVPARSYRCGYCDNQVAPERGWQTNQAVPPADVLKTGELRVCHLCNQPTFFHHPDGAQIPGARPGESVKHLPPDVERLYNEARQGHAANAFTASVLALRKLLMHVAVEKGAEPGLSFVAYVNYLDQEHYLGRDGKNWVDLIRTKSNEANHEIVLMEKQDSENLMVFAQMLLKLVYEFPGSLAVPPAPPRTP